MNKMFKFLMMGAIICSAVACSEKDEPDAPLIPAFVSVEIADASQLLLGDAGSKEVTVKANRKLEVTLEPADASSWLTADVSELDATTSSAKLTLTVTKNETEFKGRTVKLNIAAIAARDDDNVSGASAKATIDLKQSVFGLPIADLFDWKANADGSVYDASANKLEIIVGPAKPVVTFNPLYGLYEATISEISSDKYHENHPRFPGSDPANLEWYYTYNTDRAGVKMTYTNALGDKQTLDGKRMCWYKIPWSANAGIVNAYQNAFSYEFIYQAPQVTKDFNNDTGVENASIGGPNTNMFGNVNPTHCGFGIQRLDSIGAISFTYHPSFGSTVRVKQMDTVKKDSVVGTVSDFGKYYHVIATYDKNSPTELIGLYVDGVKVGGSGKDNIGLQLHFPTDWYTLQTGHEHTEGDRTPNTEYLAIGGGSHQSGYPTFGAPHNMKVVVARVYGHALTADEVTTLYNYHVPE
jgi:hypothetical protein